MNISYYYVRRTFYSNFVIEIKKKRHTKLTKKKKNWCNQIFILPFLAVFFRNSFVFLIVFISIINYWKNTSLKGREAYWWYLIIKWYLGNLARTFLFSFYFGYRVFWTYFIHSFGMTKSGSKLLINIKNFFVN